MPIIVDVPATPAPVAPTTAVAVSARRLVRDAFAELGIVQPGDDLSAEDSEYGRERLNEMLDAWRTYPGYGFSESFQTATLAANQGSVAVGAGQTINIVRPVFLGLGSFIRTSGLDRPLELVQAQTFGAIQQKNIGTTWPTHMWFDGGYPTGIIYFYPIPTETCQAHIHVHTFLPPFASINAEQYLPPGYQKAIRLSLAQELAPAYNRTSDRLDRRAALARTALIPANMDVPELSTLNAGYSRLGEFLAGEA